MPWPLVLSLAGALFAALPGSDTGNAATIEPPPVDAPARPASPETRWYGAPALIADAADVAAVVGVAEYDLHVWQTQSRDSPIFNPAMYTLVGLYLLDGPTVHFASGHRLRSAASLLLRASSLALVIALVFEISNSSGCGTDSFPHPGACDLLPYALVIPPLAAMIVDDLVLAREPVPERQPATSVTPRVIVQPGLALFVVGGTL